MSRRLAIILIVLAVLLIPFPTKTIPTWKIRIVDTIGSPCKDREVETSWGHYTIDVLGNAYHHDSQNTDAEGYVEFPTRYIWVPLLWRLIAPLFAFVLNAMHGGSGIHAIIDTKDKVDKSKAWISWEPGEPLPQEIVVENCIPTK